MPNSIVDIGKLKIVSKLSKQLCLMFTITYYYYYFYFFSFRNLDTWIWKNPKCHISYMLQVMISFIDVCNFFIHCMSFFEHPTRIHRIPIKNFSKWKQHTKEEKKKIYIKLIQIQLEYTYTYIQNKRERDRDIFYSSKEIEKKSREKWIQA